MPDNAFDPSSLEVPKAADLRRAVEAVLLYRDQDISGVGMVLDEAAAEHRTTHVVAALLFLLNRELDQQARFHGRTPSWVRSAP